MKRYAIAVLLVALFSSSAFAWVNIALTAAELAAPVVLHAGVKYFLPTAATTNVPRLGTADNYTVTRKGIGSYGNIAMAIGLTVGTTALMEYVRNHSSDYPSLAQYVNVSSVQVPDYANHPSGGFAVGTYTQGSPYPAGIILSRSALSGVAGNNLGPRTYTSGWTGRYYYLWVVTYSLQGQPVQGYNYYIDTAVQVPGPVPATASQFADAITTPDGTLEPFALPDIDHAINVAPNLFNYPDLSVKSNAQDALSDQITDIRDGLINDLQRRYDDAVARYNADPTPENQKDVDELKRQLDLQKLDNAQDSVDKAKEDEPLQDSSPDSLKQFDWSGLTRLRGALSSAWPFSLLSALPDKLSVLVRAPTAPVFHLPIYGNDLVVDLSVFNPVAAVCRWAIGLLLSVGCVYYLVEFWRGK